MASRILVCDDTPTVLDFLELVFEKQGFEVQRAGNGDLAVEQAAEANPDIVLVDAMMPGTDGFEVCRRLRANPETNAIPILMYSAVVGHEVRARALAAGADEFLGKTMSHAELVSKVRDWLATRALPGGVGDPAWLQVALDLLTLLHTDFVWLLRIKPAGAVTLALAAEHGEQQAIRFDQRVGRGPFALEPESPFARILAQHALRVGWPVTEFESRPGGSSLAGALTEAGVAAVSSAPLGGREVPRGLVLYSAPATLTLDHEAAQQASIGLRYAETALARERPAN